MNDEVKHQLQKARLEIADQDNGMKQIDENGLMTEAEVATCSKLNLCVYKS